MTSQSTTVAEDVAVRQAIPCDQQNRFKTGILILVSCYPPLTQVSSRSDLTHLVQALGGVYFSQLLFLMSAGILIPNIALVVGGTHLTSWPAAALGICTVVLSPPVSQLADFFGRKWPLVIANCFGFAGAMTISRASSMGMAIAGFTIAGMSFGVQPLLHAVVSEVLPRKHRSWAQASINVAVGLGAIFGLVVGGALVQTNPEGFRSFEYIVAAVCAASAIACALLYNPPPRDLQGQHTLGGKVRQLDWTGYGLLGSGLTLFFFGLYSGNNPYPWRSSRVLGTFLVGLMLLLLLVIYEWRFTKQGLFHHGLFQNRNFPLLLVCIFIEGLGAFSANVFLPLQLTTLYPTMGTFRAALVYTVAWIVFLVFAPLSALYVARTKAFRGVIITGFLSMLLFDILAATVKIATPEANFWGYVVFQGAGLGLLLVPLVTAAQLSTPPDLIAITSGLLLSTRSLGGSIGLAIYNAVFHHGVAQNVVPKVAAAALPLGLPVESLGPLIAALMAGDTSALAQLAGITPQIVEAATRALKESFIMAFAYVWAVAASFTAVAIIGMLACPALSMLWFC